MQETYLPYITATALHIFDVIRQGVVELISSDEEDENIVEKTENFVEVTIPNFKDNQFKEHFRMYPETFEDLLDKIYVSNERLRRAQRGQPRIPLHKQLLLTLWCLSNSECFRSVADRFGISKSCCWESLYRMCHHILEMNRKLQIIAFPNREKSVQIINEFEQIVGFPGVIGAIDASHIRIEKLHEHPNSFINGKSYPSILLQGVCDSRKLFIDVYAGEAGSIHDSQLFQKSDLYSRITDGEIEFINDCHLIGDFAYTLSTQMMVGFKNNGHLTEQQTHFNHKLSQTRVVIENTFGLLKARFRRLRAMEMRRLDLIAMLIVSACILHNICIMNNDEINFGFDDGLDINQEEAVDVVDLENARAFAKRNKIVNYLYNLR